MSGWSDPVRPPLAPGVLTVADIEAELELAIRYVDEPADSDFDPALAGFVGACRIALIECAEVLRREQGVTGDSSYDFDFQSVVIAEAMTARRVARAMINELRRLVPLTRA